MGVTFCLFGVCRDDTQQFDVDLYTQSCFQLVWEWIGITNIDQTYFDKLNS